LDNGIVGSVIGTVDTFSGLPGTVATSVVEPTNPVAANSPESTGTFARSVQPQDARADDSIVHVVQPGDTLWTIAIAYEVSRNTI
jgi:LysM repeat protein